MILAGISIATLTGENGILKKSTESKEQYNKESVREEVNLMILSHKMSYLEQTLNRDKLLEELEKNEQIEIINKENGEIEYKDYEITINEKLEITKIQEATGLRAYLSVENGLEGENGWYIGDVNLKIQGKSTKVAINSIVYQINEQEPIEIKGDNTIISLTNSGEYEIKYFVKGQDGNSSNEKTKNIKIDKELPSAKIKLSSNEMEAPGTINIQIELTNPLSKVDKEKSKYIINNSRR